MSALSEKINGAALVDAWLAFDGLAQLRPVSNEAEYDHAVSLMNQVMDRIGDTTDHPLEGLLSLLSAMVADYDRLHFALDEPAPHEMLEFLIEQGQWTPADLSGIVDQVTLEEILAARKKIDVSLAQDLAEFFKTDPQLFLKQE